MSATAEKLTTTDRMGGYLASKGWRQHSQHTWRDPRADALYAVESAWVIARGRRGKVFKKPA